MSCVFQSSGLTS